MRTRPRTGPGQGPLELSAVGALAEPAGWRTLAVMPTLAAGTTSSWIQVMEAGEFTDPRYGDFLIDAPLMDLMIANFDRLPLTPSVDLDHSGFTTGSSRAAAWYERLQRRGAEMWASVLWTPFGVAAVQSGEYRFFSPEFTYNYVDKHGDEHGAALIGGGLTNRPFLTGMAEVTLAVSRIAAGQAEGGTLQLTEGRGIFLMSPPHQEDDVKLDKLAKALGLKDDADEDAVVKALAERLPDPKPGDDGGDGETVTLSKKDHDELVALRKSNEELRLEARKVLLDKATKDLVLPPAAREHYEKLYDLDPVACSAAIAAMGKAAPDKPAGGRGVSPAPGSAAELPDDATYEVRLDATARDLMKADPKLTYRDAIYKAEGTVEDDRQHVARARASQD